VIKSDNSANAVSIAAPTGTIAGQNTIVLDKQFASAEFSSGTTNWRLKNYSLPPNTVARLDRDNDFAQNKVLGYRYGQKDISATSYLLTAADSGYLLRFTAATAVTVTLPNNLPAQWSADILQAGAGQITFTAASGATLGEPDNHFHTAKQGAQVSLSVTVNSSGIAAAYILGGYTA
jgi:hypothetical protein